jgi:hypothetical protein
MKLDSNAGEITPLPVARKCKAHYILEPFSLDLARPAP